LQRLDWEKRERKPSNVVANHTSSASLSSGNTIGKSSSSKK
jgi:hypothetical protein